MRSRPRASCFLRRFRVCFAAAVALAAVTTLPAPSCARTLQTRDLAGWWIAVDETFPTLWRRGTIVAMEELLIVTPDGRAENRSMTFEAPSPASCAGHGLCTDAPLIATARLALKSGLLTVSEILISGTLLAMERFPGFPVLADALLLPCSLAPRCWLLPRQCCSLGSRGSTPESRG